MGKDLKGKELGEGLCQIKDGRYLGRYTDAYGKRKVIYGKKLKDVKEKLNKAVYEDKLGIGQISNINITLNELYEMWFKYKLNTVRASTCRTYKITYNSLIRDDLGCKKITAIKRENIDELFIKLAERPQNVSIVKRAKALLNNMFRYAIEKNLILNNICEYAKIPKALLKENSKREALTKKQQELFFKYAEETKYMYTDLFKIILLTGMRIGEAAALTWDDVDFKNRKISINKTLAYTEKIINDEYYSIQSPKTKTSKRDIPLCETAFSILFKLKSIINSKSNNVFTNSSRNIITPSSLRASCNNFIKRLTIWENENAAKENREPISFFNITPHCFRHTFATRCFEKGIPPKVVQKYLGHSSLSMTMDLYTHVNDDLLSENITKLDDIF